MTVMDQVSATRLSLCVMHLVSILHMHATCRCMMAVVDQVDVSSPFYCVLRQVSVCCGRDMAGEYLLAVVLRFLWQGCSKWAFRWV